jgi:hypothetical protein
MPPRVGQRRNVTLVGSSGKLLHDNLLEYPVTITTPHHKIHKGDTYQCTGTLSLGNGGIGIIRISTPNTTSWAHLNLAGLMTARGANANMAIYHSGSVDQTNSAGTGQTAVNMDLNTTISHIASVYSTLSVVVTGTLAHREYVTSGNKTGGTNVSRDEIVLKQNAEHFIIFESEGANNDLGYIVRWYQGENI